MSEYPVPYENEVYSRMDGKIAQVETILEDSLITLNAFVEDMQDMLTYHVDLSSLNFAVPGLDINIHSVEPPSNITINTPSVNYPEREQLTAITIPDVVFPSDETIAPVLPERAELVIPDRELSASAPSITGEVSLPPAPEFVFPAPPTLFGITIPEFAGFTIPSYDVETPEFTVADLTNTFSYEDPAYTSTLGPIVQAWLEDSIANGTTGLSAEVEQAMYDNARSRLEEEFEAAYRKELEYFASRGFTTPTGALQAALRTVQKEFNRRLQEQNNEILIKQADLTQKNKQFAVEVGVKMEGLLRDFFTQTAARLLEKEKAAIETAVAIHTSNINAYNARCKALEAKSTAMDIHLKMLGLMVEEYKARLDAAKANGTIQQLEVENYTALLNAVKIRGDVYETQIKASLAVLEVDKAKLDMYKNQIEAFVAQVNADQAKVAVRVAQLQGDETKAKVYSETMRGYISRVEAIKARSDVDIARATFQHQIENIAKLDYYKTDIARAESELSSLTEIEKLKMSEYQTRAGVFQTMVQAGTVEADIQIKEYTAQLQYAGAMLDKAIKEAELNQQASLQENNVKLESLKAVANVMAQLVASALSAVNASIQMGYSGGYNISGTAQLGTNKSEQHIYQDYCDASCSGTSQS
jgi:hypothetical protein